MDKFEKPENAVSGYYMPTLFPEKVMDAINEAEEIDASEEFVFGFITALSFVCNPADAQTHGIEPVEYIEKAFGHYLARYRVVAVEDAIAKIGEALKDAGFEAHIEKIILGGDR